VDVDGHADAKPRSTFANKEMIDTTALKEVLLAYHSGDDNAVEAKLNQLSEQNAMYLYESLAVASSLDNRPHIFKLCMDRDFTYRHHWIMHANRLQQAGNTTAPEISKILDESRYRELYPRRVAREDVNKPHGTEEERNRPLKRNADGTIHIDQLVEWDHDVPR
jgi:hypothetical protein